MNALLQLKILQHHICPCWGLWYAVTRFTYTWPGPCIVKAEVSSIKHMFSNREERHLRCCGVSCDSGAT